MSDLVERLRTDHFFSNSVMAARMEEDEMTIDIMRSERKEAAARIEQLEERMRGAAALFVLWETRATRAEARIKQLEAALREIENCNESGLLIKVSAMRKTARAALAPEQDK